MHATLLLGRDAVLAARLCVGIEEDVRLWIRRVPLAGGVTVLAGANTYTGATTARSETLSVTHNQAFKIVIDSLSVEALI